MPQIIPVPAVNAAIFNEDGKILLTQRSATVREPGKWCLPGGHIEIGETWSQALRREVREEVGLTVTDETLLGVYSDPNLTIADGKHFVVVTFRVVAYSGDVVCNDEVGEWGWFDADRLPTPMLKSHPVRVKDAFEFRGRAFAR